MQHKLHFHKIRYRNLLSTGSAWTEVDLEVFPMTLIIGKNGDGKSTLIDALCFALFGKPFRKINKPQLVNSVTKKEMLVEVEFTIQGWRFKVIRGMKPNVFEVWRHGTLLNQPGDSRDYQAELEKYILRTNMATFNQIVILGSANYVPFMQLKTLQRREVTEDIYDLKIFTSMNSVLKDRLTKAEREVDRLENMKESIEGKIELSRKHQETVVEDKTKWIEAKQVDIDRALIEITRLDDEAERLRQVNELLAFDVDLETSRKLKVTKLLEMKTKIEINAESVKKDMKFLDEHDDCPTCKQAIAEDFRVQAFQAKRSKLDEITGGLSLLNEKVEEAFASVTELNNPSKAFSENQTSIVLLSSRIMNQKSIIAKAEKDITLLEKEQVATVDESTLTDLEDELLERKRDWAALVRQKDMMSYVAVLLKDTGIKSKIVKKYSGTFNQLVNSYLAKLDFFVDFHLDENFEEVIKSRGRDTFSYNSFSEGEKLRIDLAVLFAWRQIAKLRASLSTNILIMDEIFDSSLDVDGVEDLMKIMTRVTENSNVFVISHQTDRLSDHFDRTLTFTKRKGFSEIAA